MKKPLPSFGSNHSVPDTANQTERRRVGLRGTGGSVLLQASPQSPLSSSSVGKPVMGCMSPIARSLELQGQRRKIRRFLRGDLSLMESSELQRMMRTMTPSLDTSLLAPDLLQQECELRRRSSSLAELAVEHCSGRPSQRGTSCRLRLGRWMVRRGSPWTMRRLRYGQVDRRG